MMKSSSQAASSPVSSGRAALPALVAVVALALALGATAAALTVVYSVLLEKLPFRDPGRLVMIDGSFTDKGGVQPFPISQMDFADWRKRSTVFSQLSVYGGLGFNLEQGPRSRRLSGELVNAGYLELLGLRPALGRFFTPDEDARALEKYVVVLGYDLWRSTFGADPSVVGSQLRLNGQLYSVVGVGPPGFRGLSDQADLWVPSMLPPIPDYLNVRRERWISGAARLAAGITVRQAQQQMDAITGALAHQFPNMNQGIGATVTPMAESWFGKLRHPLFLITAVAALMLLLAGWDAAVLLAAPRPRPRPVSAAPVVISRASGASGISGAAGVSGAAWAAGIAGIVALVLAWLATPALIEASGAQLPSFVQRTPGAMVSLAVVAMAALCGIGIAAAGAAPGRRHRVQMALAVVQVALALVFLAGAARQARGYRQLITKDLGFNRRGLLTFRMDLKGKRYMDNALVSRLLREQYLPRIAAVQGVRQAALCNPTMPTDGLVGGYMTIDDHASGAPDGTYIATWHSVSPGFFETLGVPILAGRSFTPADTDSNAVIVGKAFADQQWPGKNPLGRRIKQDARAVKTEPWMTVVGVASEAHHEGIQSEGPPPDPDIYMPLYQFPLRLPLTINFLVRPRPGVAIDSLGRVLHEAMMSINPELPDYDMSTLEERLAKQTMEERFQVVLKSLFAGMAVILAAAGIYGLRRATIPADGSGEDRSQAGGG